MIRRELIEGGPEVLIRLWLADKVEVHDLHGNVVESRPTTPEERAAHLAWEAASDPDVYVPLRRSDVPSQAERKALVAAMKQAAPRRAVIE